MKLTTFIFLILFSTGNLLSQVFTLGSVYDLDPVFEDGYKLPVMNDSVNIFGIRGEIISGQFVISAKKQLNDVTVQLSDFKEISSGATLPSGSVEWNFVGSIPLTKNTPNQPERELTRKAPARYPEYLMTERSVNMPPKTFRAVWLTISVPGNIREGTYAGKATVTCSQGEQSLPVCIRIYPLTLSSERHLKVTEWYSTDAFNRMHGISERYSTEWFAMLRKYAENMTAHRQNVFQVPMSAIEISRNEDGRLAFNFTRFDQIAQVFWDTKNMDYLETGEIMRFGDNAWFSTTIKVQDFRVKNERTGTFETIPGDDVAPYLLPEFENHLRKKGWLDKTLFHVKDEPSMHNAVAWREKSSYIHRLAPDLKRIDAIETTNLLNDIEIAVPKLDALGTWHKFYEEARRRGVELWFYTVGIYQGSLFPNKTIDLPVMNSRILHWLNYKYDATGFLHWGWNQWEEDPFKDVGMHIGDGWHVYPSKDGVLNSLRWEQMRNGIQDYECFKMLEEKINALRDSLGTRASWIIPSQRGKEITSRIVMDFDEHSDDPGSLYKAKEELIKELITFNKPPEIYVQTIPAEGSTITFHSSVELYGWAAPGTKIVVNGKELPVNDQGYFFEQFGGEALDNTKIGLSEGSVFVQATKDGKTTEIVRRFNVKR
ncbi:MAG: DUF4091 domain-containing protein [Bacteroidales bacterium]|nr:DUF4091 domain-containing protein [Bacteroidales bacterium]